jgi:hypothetical protein
MVCVFASIGQRAAALLGLAFSLFSRSLTDFLLFVAAFSFDSPSLQYFCPYAAATVSEFFMWSGQIGAFASYDDLSKHAGSYREIYLLLKRPPGREAYPGEIFFVHSRLLERAAKLSLACGGGSVTAFPVIETLAGDVSSYISTNVISITDGQIFMAMELFAADRRPPVDFTLSVTRVGSAAQWAGVKALCGSYKVQLSQYFELAAFSQFSSDLGADTLRALKRGRLLVALLKQGCFLTTSARRAPPASIPNEALSLCETGIARFRPSGPARHRPLFAAAGSLLVAFAGLLFGLTDPGLALRLPWFRPHVLLLNDPGRLIAVHCVHTGLIAGWAASMLLYELLVIDGGDAVLNPSWRQGCFVLPFAARLGLPATTQDFGPRGGALLAHLALAGLLLLAAAWHWCYWDLALFVFGARVLCDSLCGLALRANTSSGPPVSCFSLRRQGLSI